MIWRVEGASLIWFLPMASFSLYLRACVFYWSITDERKRRSFQHSSFLSNFIATVFMVLNLNQIMSIIFNVPAIVISTVSTSLSGCVPLTSPSTWQIAACRAVRRLTNFTYDGPAIILWVLLCKWIILVSIDLLVLTQSRLIIGPSPGGMRESCRHWMTNAPHTQEFMSASVFEHFCFLFDVWTF